jgi:hypothetical protein
MNTLIIRYESITKRTEALRDIPLLLLRLVLAYGFWGPGMMKWSNIDKVSTWFDGMGIPLPTVNAYLSASAEAGGSVNIAPSWISHKNYHNSFNFCYAGCHNYSTFG